LPSKRRRSSSTARPVHPQARQRQHPSLSFSPHRGSIFLFAPQTGGEELPHTP
jgi:hypothetical protein